MSDEINGKDQTAYFGNGQGKTFVSSQAGFFDLVVEEPSPPVEPPIEPTSQSTQTVVAKDTFGVSPTRSFWEIDVLLKSLQADIDHLEEIKTKFLDPEFIRRARIVHATTPDFMDREFIETFNSYCFFDESLQLKFDELEKWFFEIGPEISPESSAVMGKFKVNLAKVQSDFEQGRYNFQEKLEAVMQEVAGQDPRFIDYMHNLKPTFAMPTIDLMFKSELDQIAYRASNGGSIVPTLNEALGQKPYRESSGLQVFKNYVNRVADWWRNASTKTRALAVGVIASVVATLGVGGTLAVAKSQENEPVGLSSLSDPTDQPAMENAGHLGSAQSTTTTTMGTTTSNVPTTTTQDLPEQPVVPMPEPEVSSTSIVPTPQPNVPQGNQARGVDQTKDQHRGGQSISITG